MTTPCLQNAWSVHEAELRNYLRHRLGDAAEADDLLHDLFLKVWRQGEAFCAIANPRAWLFEVARNLIVDRRRKAHRHDPLPDQIASTEPEEIAVDALADCLPRVLAELSAEDREAIVLCDLGDMTQARFAELKGLSLPGAKSRVQRARRHLRERMSQACQVRFDEAGRVCCFVPRPPLPAPASGGNDEKPGG